MNNVVMKMPIVPPISSVDLSELHENVRCNTIHFLACLELACIVHQQLCELDLSQLRKHRFDLQLHRRRVLQLGIQHRGPMDEPLVLAKPEQSAVEASR